MYAPCLAGGRGRNQPTTAIHHPHPLFRCKEETTTTGKDIACQDSSLCFGLWAVGCVLWALRSVGGFWRTTKWKVFQITTHSELEWVGGTRR